MLATVFLGRNKVSIEYKDIHEFTEQDLKDLFLSVEWSSGHFPDKLVVAMKNFKTVISAWDGDKPLNSNGGRTAFGHAHAASGLADVYEACKQIWGEMGEHQVKIKNPKTAMLRGYGGAQNVAAIILQKKD